MRPLQSNIYTYEPLSQDAPEIRIAIIEPATQINAPIRFTFHTAFLEDLEGQYEALSYVWGASNLNLPVYHTSNGHQLQVTENLDFALRRLRRKTDPRWVWADALCIDQNNDHEKASQIPLMVDIFRSATRVVAWLHQDNESIEQGMLCVERLSRRSLGHRVRARQNDVSNGQSRAERTTSKPSNSVMVGSPAEGIDGANHPLSAKESEDLLAFLTLPYFRRLWIVQEIISSLDIILICGQVELSWLRMITALTDVQNLMLTTTPHPLGHSTASLRKTASLWRMQCIEQKSFPTHIFDLVSEYSSYGCTDARDRIFAVHALSQERNADVKIDYTLDVPTTYRRFAMACMADGQMFKVLKAASARVNIHSTEVSSWVPDWRIEVTMDDSLKCEDEYFFYDEFYPMVDFSTAVDEDTIQLVFKSFRKSERESSKESSLYPLRVSGRVHASMNQPLYDFINAVVSFYAKVRWSTQSDQVSLWSLLQFFWGIGPSSLGLHHFRALLECLHARLSVSEFDFKSCVAKHEDLLTRPIAAASKGRCFFEASFEDSDEPEFCYGSVHVQAGDILLPLVEGLHNYGPNCSVYRMCILRPAMCSEVEAMSTHAEATWTDIAYRVVGEAWLVYPSEDASLTRNSICPTFKVTLC